MTNLQQSSGLLQHILNFEHFKCIIGLSFKSRQEYKKNYINCSNQKNQLVTFNFNFSLHYYGFLKNEITRSSCSPILFIIKMSLHFHFFKDLQKFRDFFYSSKTQTKKLIPIKLKVKMHQIKFKNFDSITLMKQSVYLHIIICLVNLYTLIIFLKFVE